MSDCGLHYLWFAFVCFLIRSPPPPFTKSDGPAHWASNWEALGFRAIVSLPDESRIGSWVAYLEPCSRRSGVTCKVPTCCAAPYSVRGGAVCLVLVCSCQWEPP